MLRGQHLRVMASQDVDDITTILSGQDSTSIAMNEIADDTLGYVKEDFDEAIKDTNADQVVE